METFLWTLIYSWFYLSMPGAKSFFLLMIFPLFFFGTVDRIQRALSKSDFEKASELIIKAYEKEPDNPGVYYLHAQLLFTISYNHYDPDSARQTLIRAKGLWEVASLETREELKQENITDYVIDSLAIRIRDFFFSETIREVSREKINTYLSTYPVYANT